MHAATFLYEEVAQDLVTLIEAGSLRSGDRVPSVRLLSRERGVSVSTVLQAYRTLEDRGWVEARPQSGFYVRARPARNVPEPFPSRPAPTAGRVPSGDLILEVVEGAAANVPVPLGAGAVSPALLPGAALSRELGRVARSASPVHLAYAPPQGVPELRVEIARRAALWGGTLAPDDLIVTAGCMEALALSLLTLTRPGDAVAVESPAFFAVLRLLQALGLRAVEIPTRPDTGICLDALAEALDRTPVAACLLTPSFHNPLGATVPDDDRARLVALLAARGVPLIEDDIYGDLHHGPQRPRPCKAFDGDGLVLYCSSFSKTLAPGLRVGFVAPGRFLADVLRQKVATNVTGPAITQLALARYLARGGYEHHLRRLRTALATNLGRLHAAVAEHFPEGTRLTRPEGGFLLWAELPEGCDAVALYRAARAEGITSVPGPAFSATGGYPRGLRLNAGHPWSDAIERGVARLGELARAQRLATATA